MWLAHGPKSIIQTSSLLNYLLKYFSIHCSKNKKQQFLEWIQKAMGNNGGNNSAFVEKFADNE